MKKIARDNRQITFFYNPESSIGKKTLDYLQESVVPTLTVDLLKNSPTPSQWIEIANDLGMEVSELILKDHPVFKKQYSTSDLDTDGWLKVMHHHPEVIDQPIAIRGDKVLLVKIPTDILQLLKTTI
jgi:arsenate reductase